MNHSFPLVFSTYPPVSVSGTDPTPLTLGDFSWKPIHSRRPGKNRTFPPPRSPLAGARGNGWKTSNPRELMYFVIASKKSRRAGILTSCPSAAAFAIALGPPNPWLIASATETLDFRGSNFSLGLWLLMPTFSLPYPPLALAGRTSANTECSPTTRPARRRGESISSVACLAPVHFWRTAPSNSELLHTL